MLLLMWFMMLVMLVNIVVIVVPHCVAEVYEEGQWWRGYTAAE